MAAFLLGRQKYPRYLLPLRTQQRDEAVIAPLLKNAEPRGAAGRDGAIRLSAVFEEKQMAQKQKVLLFCACFPQAPKMPRSSGEHRPFSGQQKRFLSKDQLLQFEPIVFIFLTVTVILFCSSKTCTSHFCSALNIFLKETWLTITFGGGCVCGHTANESARVTRCRLHAG